MGQTHDSCKTKYGLDGLVSIYKYNGTIKKLIGKLKYGYVTDIATTLIDGCVTSLATFPVIQNSLLVPIPLSPRRKNWRGFNQSELLGEKIAKQLGWNYEPKLIKRIVDRHPQVGLKNEERVRNTCGEYAVNRDIARGVNQSKTIVLFDDVWTTGSTIKEACKILKMKGFMRVWGITIAR